MFDVIHKFVRIIETRTDGMVEFQFAIGEPELFVELMMPVNAFQEFCVTNQVQLLAPVNTTSNTTNDWEWSLHQALHQRFKSPE